MKQTVFLKRAACLLLAILASLSLAACGTESKAPESTAPVTHAYDPAADGEPGELCVIFYGKGEDTAGHDLSVWDRELISSHKDDSAPETASIELMGKTFEGKYSYSAVFYPATHLSHVYTGEFGGKDMMKQLWKAFDYSYDYGYACVRTGFEKDLDGDPRISFTKKEGSR